MKNINLIAAIGTTLQNNIPTALASLGSGSINDKNVEVKSSNSEKPEEYILQNILFIVVVFMIVSLIFLICWLINVYLLDKNGNAISMENWRENPQVKIEIPPKEKFQRYKKMFVRYEEKILPKYQNKTLDESIWFDFNRDQSIWFEIPIKCTSQEKSVSFQMKMMKNDCEILQKDSNKSESQEILKKNQNTEKISIVDEVREKCILNTLPSHESTQYV